MQTKLLIIRHGQSFGNLEKRCCGHEDVDLTELGIQQAYVCAERLRNEKIDAIYSSDLIRAHKTAVPHSKLRNLPIIDSVNLREIYLGDWENSKVEFLQTHYRDSYLIGWCQNFGTFCPPNGESVPQLAERLYNEILRIAKENVGKTVLITTHSAALRAFWGKISNIPASELAEKIQYAQNTSISTVVYDGENLLPISYSDGEHLNNIK